MQTIHTRHSYGRRGWYGAGSSHTTVRQYEQGTLLLDLIDPESKQLIWRGTGQTRLRDLKTPEEREARVREVVDRILERFPPEAS